jgi:hypothetical protein
MEPIRNVGCWEHSWRAMLGTKKTNVVEREEAQT